MRVAPRRLLPITMSLLVALGLSACAAAVDPRIDVAASASPRSDLWRQAAAAESALADTYAQAALYAKLAGSNALETCVEWCPAAQAMHAAHATTLTQPDPWGGYVKPAVPSSGATGAPAFSDADSATAALQKAAQACLDADRAGLVAAQPGQEAMLWASLAATARASVAYAANPATVRPPPLPGDVVPSPRTPGPTLDAATRTLDAVNTLIYGLTTAMAQPSTSAPLRQQLVDRLASVNADVNTLQATIGAAGQTPPPAQLAYTLPGTIDSDDAVRATWGILESAVAMDYVRLAGTQTGDAAAHSADRADFGTATALGQAVTWWPGWG